MIRPSVFIGSSSEGLKIAQSVQVALDHVSEPQLWSQGAFGLTKGNLESLVNVLPKFDFAVLVLTVHDLLISRGKRKLVARDNVLFELGLFIGGLGRDRTFFVYDRNKPPELPSDLAGVTAATYALQSSGNLQAALGAPCTLIQDAIEKLGVRKERNSEILDGSKIFSFDDVKLLIAKLYRRMESEFCPDIIVTMSGAGSIAACYLSHLNTRDVPLFVAITFPKSRVSKEKASVRKFLAVSKTKPWQRIKTNKWEIFLPNLLFEFPAGTKVVVFDDRVLSGSSQKALRDNLTSKGYDVKRAAVFTSSAQESSLDWYGMIINEEFHMPWGPKDGRY